MAESTGPSGAQGSESLATKFRAALAAGQASRPARLAAARGALPLAPGELLELQVLLENDADDDVRAAASASLDALGEASVLALVEDRETPVAAITFIAERIDRWPAAALPLCTSPRVPATALRRAASLSRPDVLALLAGNHEALAADERLGEALLANPSLQPAERLRLLDTLDELSKVRARASHAATDAPDPGTSADAVDVAPARDPFLAALGIDAEVEALLPEIGIDLGALQERSELVGDSEEGDDASLIYRLSQMKIGQKLRVALFGGREERLVLVRDSNRIVAAAVIKNPKFTAQEAETAANSRNVNDEVLRLVARHRDFGKLYTVQHNLVRNPRCPPEIALATVPQLNERDLKLLLKNRNIGEAVRRHAKKILDAREERKRIRVGKK